MFWCCCGDRVNLPGCPCTDIPRNLTMHVASQPPPHIQSVVFASDLTYGARPADLAIYRSDNPGWYSSAKFTASDSFYKYRYWFGCSQGGYFVGLLYTPDSPLAYPGFSGIASALVGLPGNTCSPFSLHTLACANPTFQAQGITID